MHIHKTAFAAAIANAVAVVGADNSSSGYSDHPSKFTTTYSPSANGFSTGACLNELYQQFRTDEDEEEEELICNNGSDKFWTRVQLKAPPTCVEGQNLMIEDLTFESRFMEDAHDFAVSTNAVHLHWN